MLVSIIIPVIRPEKAKRCIEAIRKNAGIPHFEELSAQDIMAGVVAYEIVTEEDKKRIGVTKMVKRLTDKSKGELVCFIGDDCVPSKDFLKNAIHAMQHIPDGWGMVSFNDNPTTTRSAAHWLAHKKLLPFLGGEFFHTGYRHCFCDDELLIRCQEMNRYIYAYDAFIYHEHPLTDPKVKPDENFESVHREEIYNADHELFKKRMDNGWVTPEPQETKEVKRSKKVMIAIPSNDTWHADFAMSLVNLCIHSISRGIHVAIVNEKRSLLEISRNMMVQTAFEHGADYLLTLDSDMVFPPATLQRLLSHEKDIVCADAVRRREPIETVLIGMDGQKIKHDPKAGAKDPLIEVKGGSNAVALMKMDVFKKIKPPHYLVEYKEKTQEFLSEDFYFTNKARQAGIKFWCDPHLSNFIGHIGCKAYYLKDQKNG